MLRGISPLISPDLLATMSRMGHRDELVLVDAHYPAHSMNPHVIRADGLMIRDLLEGILPLFVLDDYTPKPLVMMAANPGDTLDPAVEAKFREPIDRHAPGSPAMDYIPPMDFYERSRKAYAIVVTGETGKYHNILLTKGVTPV
ncbi:MAG: L-fucose mutarotase [Phycisphaerales bacterium JB063]